MVMSAILPTLFVGSEADSTNWYQLTDNKITHVVRIYNNPEMILREVSIKYYFVKALDMVNVNLRQHFSVVNDFIHGARLGGGAVLVHCAAGVSRSVTLATAYLLSATDLSLRDAQNYIRMVRYEAQPNEGFQRQLEAFEKNGLQQERERLHPNSSHLYVLDNTHVRNRLAATGRRVIAAERLSFAIRDRMRIEYELEDMTVTHVVRIGTSREELATKSSITYHFIELPSDLPDDFDLRKHLPDANDFIHEARLQKNCQVLINWTSGSLARGVVVLLAYLLSVHTKLNLDELLKHVTKEHGQTIQDMDQWMERLRMFQKEGLEDERKRMAEKFSLKEDEDECLQKDREFIAKSLAE